MEPTLNDLKDRLKVIDEVINEGEQVEAILRTVGWEIIRKTLLAQSELYKIESFKAAKSSLSNLGNFLGRYEAIEESLELITKQFTEKKIKAYQDRLDTEHDIESLIKFEEENRQPVGTMDEPGGML